MNFFQKLYQKLLNNSSQPEKRQTTDLAAIGHKQEPQPEQVATEPRPLNPIPDSPSNPFPRLETPLSTYRSPLVNNHLLTVLPQHMQKAKAIAQSRTIPPDLLALAVEDGLMPPTQALLIAENQPDPAGQALALHQLSRWLPPDSLAATWAGLPAGAQQAAHTINQLSTRATTLAQIGAKDDALAIAKMISDPTAQVETLVTIKAWSHALEALSQIEGLWEKSDRLSKLAATLPAGFHTQAIELAHSLHTDPRYMAEAMCALIPHLSAPHRTTLGAWVWSISDDFAQGKIGGALLAYLPAGADRDKWLTQLGERAEAQSYQPNRVQAWTFLLPAMTLAERQAKLPELIEAARAIDSQLFRLEMMGQLTIFTPPAGRDPLLNELNTLMSQLPDDLHRNRLWSEWALALMKQNEIATGLAYLHHTDNEYLIIGYLREALPYLRQLPAPQWLPQIPDLLPTPTLRSMFWQEIVPDLPSEAQNAIWHDVQQFPDPGARRAGLIMMAPYRPQERRELLREALASANNRRKSSEPLLLAALARHYPAGTNDLLDQALTYLADWDTVNQAYILADMLSELGETAPAGFITRLEQTLHPIDDDSTLLRLWINLLPHAPASKQESWCENTLNVVLTSATNSALDQYLRQLLPYLTDERINDLWVDILPRLNEIQLTAVLQTCVGRLSPAGLQHTLDHLTRLPTHKMSILAQGLALLAPHLTPPQLPQAQEAADNIRFPAPRIQAQASLASRLGQPLHADLLAEARSISIPASQMAALTDLATYLPPHKRTPLLQEALALLPNLEDDNQRSFRLLPLVPLITPAMVDETMHALSQIASERFHSQLLRAIIPVLPANRVGVALPLIAKLGSIYDFDQTMEVLIQHLPADLLIEALVQIRTRAHEPALRLSLPALITRWPELAQSPALDERTELHLTLRAFTRGGLLTFVPTLRALLPELIRLGGMSLLLEIRRLIADL